MNWLSPLKQKLAQGVPVVRLVVARVRGSAPREEGATILVWLDDEGKLETSGTIGGGHLEFTGIEKSGAMLKQPEPLSRKWEMFILGASLGQCCGGVVELYWERFDSLADIDDLVALDFSQTWVRYCAIEGDKSWISHAGEVSLPKELSASNKAAIVTQIDDEQYYIERLQDDRQALWLYGAGHVASALVRVLQDLPFRITWVDSRVDTLEKAMKPFAQSGNITALSGQPDSLAATAPESAWHLIMTHSHYEDFDICDAVLSNRNYRFLGLIGSQVKSKRFRKRLIEKNHAEALVADITCPIGIPGISSKLPSAIAVSVSFQLLQQLEHQTESEQVMKTIYAESLA